MGEIPESWLDLCYPTMEDLDGFLVIKSLKNLVFGFLQQHVFHGPGLVPGAVQNINRFSDVNPRGNPVHTPFNSKPRI